MVAELALEAVADECSELASRKLGRRREEVNVLRWRGGRGIRRVQDIEQQVAGFIADHSSRAGGCGRGWKGWTAVVDVDGDARVSLIQVL